MPTYRDYLWLRPYFDTSFANGYCAAVIRNCAPDEVLNLLGAGASQSEAVGLAEVAEVEAELSEQATPRPGHPVVAVAPVSGDSTLLLQLNGGAFAITEELMRPLLMDYEVVSHYRSVNADGRFRWWTDGELIADFDPVLPELPSRFGPATAQDRVVDLIRKVGGIRIDASSEGNPSEHHSGEGAFALAEQITGVEITAALLDTAVFTVAVVDRGDKAPPTVSSVARTEVSEWGEVARRYAAAARVPLHGVMDKVRPRGSARPDARLEFWYKPRTCIRLADDDGVLFLQNRKRQTWFRTDGVLERRDGGYSLDIHIEQLLRIHTQWPDTPFKDLLPSRTRGRVVEIGGRSAWEFSMPPNWAGLESTVAFDAEFGIPLRWEDRVLTHEISDLEVRVDVDDDFFTGP